MIRCHAFAIARAFAQAVAEWRAAWTAVRIEVPQQGATCACGALAARNTLYRSQGWGFEDYAHPRGQDDLGELTQVLRRRMLLEISAGLLFRGATRDPQCVFQLVLS